MTSNTTTDAHQRLKRTQAELERRGAVSIGLTLGPSAGAMTLSQVKADVADFFDAWLAGRGVPMGEFGDSPTAGAGA